MEKEIIKKIMYEEHITQAEIAIKCRVNQQTISALLGREGSMKVERLAEICEAMGYEVVIRKGEKEYVIDRADEGTVFIPFR